MTAETDKTLCMVAIALADLNGIVSAMLTTLGKQVMGQTAEARADFLKAVEMQTKNSDNLQALLDVTGTLLAGNNTG